MIRSLDERFGLRFLFIGLLVLFSLLLIRATGIHCDEANYVKYSYTNGSGDSKGEGKPPLFYFANLLIMNSLGYLIFPWRPLALHLFYGAFNILALCWLTKKLSLPPPRRWLFFSLILFSPFFLFNSTQVMMETPILGLLLIAFGAAESGFPTQFSWIGVVSLILAMQFKETSFFAILILMAAYSLPLKPNRTLLRMGLALIIAVGLRAVVLWSLGIGRNKYSDPSRIFSFPAIQTRLETVSSYTEMWFFYLWPPSLMAGAILVVWASLKNRGRLAHLFLLVAFSFLATVVVQLISNYDFARYCYPVITLGIAALTLILARAVPLAIGWGLCLSFLVPNFFMTYPPGGRLSHWPPLVSNETYYSGMNSFAGAPVLGWFAVRGWKFSQLCVWTGPEPRKYQGMLVRNIDNFRRNAQYFEPPRWEEFQKCDGAHLIARIDYLTVPTCAPHCPKSEYALASCNQDKLSSAGTANSFWINRYCLP